MTVVIVWKHEVLAPYFEATCHVDAMWYTASAQTLNAAWLMLLTGVLLARRTET